MRSSRFGHQSSRPSGPWVGHQIAVYAELLTTELEQVIDAPVSSRKPGLLNSRSRIEERADDRNVVNGTITVDHTPCRLTERRPAVHILGFQWRGPAGEAV